RERLAHALEHDAVHALAARGLERAPDDAHLLDDLPGLEVAPQPEAPRRAERAGERAADLRAHADAETPGTLERDAHGLDQLVVVRAQGELDERVEQALR